MSPRVQAAVVLDIGETVVDDSRIYVARARQLGVSPHTLAAVIGALRAEGGERTVRDVFRPRGPAGSDAPPARDAGGYVRLTENDLYPEVREVLGRLRSRGFWVGLAGNQPPGIAEDLRALALPVDAIATSAEWGVAKPAAGFYRRLVEWTGNRSSRVLYIGDQVQNDVVAAQRAGLRAVHLVRGPWGYLDADDPRVARCALAQIRDLTELEETLDRLDWPAD